MMWLLGFLSSLLLVVSIQSFNLELVKQQHFSTDFTFDGARLGGLSSLTYNPDRNVFYAAADRSNSQNQVSRFFEVTLDLSSSQTSDWVDFKKVHNWNTDPLESVDVEGMVYDPEKKVLFMAQEGSASLDEPVRPSVFKSTIDGFLIDPNLEFVIPGYYNAPANDETIGVTRGKSFETTTLSANLNMLVVATEHALSQDHTDAPGFAGKLRSRVLFLNKRSRKPIKEHVYVLAAPPKGDIETHGLVDMITLNDTHYLATELTTFADGSPAEINLFEVSFATATDTLGEETVPEDCLFAEKSRLCQLVGGSFGVMDLGNLEGASFGPDAGRDLVEKRLVYVTDNDYRDQRTSFYMFKISM